MPDAESPKSPKVISEVEVLRWADTLAGIARTGLAFTESTYEQERYDEILHVAAEIRQHAGLRHDPDALVAEWLKSVGDGVPGYVTPKVAIGAIVTNDDGKILLIERADSGVWLYPTGWADIGYSASEVAQKEVHEETGIEVEIVRPVAIYDGLRRGYSRVPLYSLVFHCRAVGGALNHHPVECNDVGWFGPDELPSPLAGFDDWGDLAFALARGEEPELVFERPRQPPWAESEAE